MRAKGVEPPHPLGYKDLNIPRMSHIELVTLKMRVVKSETGRKHHSSEPVFTGFSPENRNRSS